MSVNKTIGGLSVLSSANIKGCFSLPVWDSDAQTTKSACINDLVTAGGNIFTAGTGICSSVRCGVNNLASGNCSISLGGCRNSVSGAFSSILGGRSNCISGLCLSVVAGGNLNCAIESASSIVGGCQNVAGCLGFVGGGASNKALGTLNAIISGSSNCLTQIRNSFVIGGNCNTIITEDTNFTQSGYNSIAGGTANSIYASKSTTSAYIVSANYNCIGSGRNNRIYSCSCNCTYMWSNVISDGDNNFISNCDSGSNVYGSFQSNNTIRGGINNNFVQVVCSTTDSSVYATMLHGQILGGEGNKICTLVNNPTTLGEILNCNNTIVGGYANQISLVDTGTIGEGKKILHNAILTGYGNTISNNCSVGFGCYNAIVGGRQNVIRCSSYSAISGGCRNTITSSSCNSLILGGASNNITSVNCSMAFGQSNVVAHNFAGVVGCGITSVLDCALHTNRMVVTNMPTSSAGLPSGTLYSDAGTIKIVP